MSNESNSGNEPLGVLAITHYNRLLDELKPDHVHILAKGRIVDERWPRARRPTRDRRLRRLRRRRARGGIVRRARRPLLALSWTARRTTRRALPSLAMSNADEEQQHRNVVRVVDAGAALGLTVEPVRFPEGTKTAVDAANAIGCDVGQIVKSLIFAVDGEVVLAYVSGANQLDEAQARRPRPAG